MTFLRPKGDLPAQWIDLIDDNEVPRVTVYALPYAEKAQSKLGGAGVTFRDGRWLVVVSHAKVNEDTAIAACTLFGNIVSEPVKEGPN